MDYKVRDVGMTIKVDGGHRAMGADFLATEVKYATETGKHLWSAVVLYKLIETDLEDPSQLQMDAENLMATGFFCYICEEPLTRELLHSTCPGSQSDHEMENNS